MGKRAADLDEDVEFQPAIPSAKGKKKAKKEAKEEGDGQTAEERQRRNEQLEQAKRLTDRSFRLNMFARTKSNLVVSRPETKVPQALVDNHGSDVIKKGSTQHVSKYCFVFPGNFQTMAAGEEFGTLSGLDTPTPCMYVNFPEGRLKLLGALAYPKNKLITLQCSKHGMQIGDTFDHVVVFSEVMWVGTKEENPQEKALPMPEHLKSAPVKRGHEQLSRGIMDAFADVEKRSTSDRPTPTPGSEDETSATNSEAPSRRSGRATKKVVYSVDSNDDFVPDQPTAADKSSSPAPADQDIKEAVSIHSDSEQAVEQKPAAGRRSGRAAKTVTYTVDSGSEGEENDDDQPEILPVSKCAKRTPSPSPTTTTTTEKTTSNDAKPNTQTKNSEKEESGDDGEKSPQENKQEKKNNKTATTTATAGAARKNTNGNGGKKAKREEGLEKEGSGESGGEKEKKTENSIAAMFAAAKKTDSVVTSSTTKAKTNDKKIILKTPPKPKSETPTAPSTTANSAPKGKLFSLFAKPAAPKTDS
eukprot:comp22295_c2_seq1/m.33067 comp22295_c2_seq1/g.33067  ORF comp22295_c2_seq1/g.33067 comp22295_c2_seq1/m.33067 type:complete len:529 (-) comp22295_c2_seq1:276-1862(-)